MSNLDSFAVAFDSMSSSVWAICECGTEFGSGEAVGIVDRWYGLLEVEGKLYVQECGCWKPEAQQIADWIDANKHQIVVYLRLEKMRLTELARRHPTVEELG